MLLRTELLDAAVSIAKAYGHPQVEPRHVMFAVAKRFRAHDQAAALFERARQALEPHGRETAPPNVSPEAGTLLATIHSEQDAVQALVTAFEGGRSAGSEVAGTKMPQATAATSAPAFTSTAQSPPRKSESTAEILAELDGLVGLVAVKSQVRNVIAVVQANAQRAKAGLVPVNPSLHLVFTGPPGTGKTTVARLVSRLYASTGALPGSGFMEASRADLVAGYVGQTAIKTTEVINRTRPGVLFIDEAYALVQRAHSDFGHEAVATLVKAMEDYRSDLAVVVAGYGDEMADFIGSNPGLRSRFKTYISFPDYTASELLRIFAAMAAEVGISVSQDVLSRAERVLEDVARMPDFGNARYVRSLFEMAYAKMAARAAEDGDVTVAELTALQPDDIVSGADSLRRDPRKIGFRRPE